MQTVIDINDYLQRDKLVWNPAQYPKGIDDAVGFLVKEKKDVLPHYHPTPGPFVHILHAAGEMDDETYERLRDQCGANEDPRFNVHLAVAGNQKCWGNNLYRSLLMVGNSFNKDGALAFDEKEKWDYRFLPGMLRLGRTGRVVDGCDEELYVNIAPDLVYSSITDGGIRIDNIAMLMSDGTKRIVVENGKRIESMYPASIKTNRWQEYNHDITLPDLLGVQSSSFSKETEHLHDMYIFETKRLFESLEAMTDTYARETDNIVWKLAGLPIKSDNPNNFFQKSTWHMRYSPCIWPGGVALGSTGRQIRVQNRIMDNGHEAPACWQSEHIWFHISRDIICQALTELPDLERVVMYEGFDDPWEIVYEKDGSASPSNPKPYIMATEMPPKPSIPEELLDDIKPRGIKPESDVN